MSAASTTLQGRQAIEDMMVDTCRIKRHDPNARNWNETTGQYEGDAGVLVYEGKCRIQVRSDINANAVEAVIGEHEWTYRTATVQLPIDGTGAVVSDCVFEMVNCALDAGMNGRFYNLQADSKGKTHATHRRFRARELLS